MIRGIARPLAIALVVAGLVATGRAGAASTVPALQVIPRSGYVVGVSGSGWVRSRPVALTLSAPGVTAGLQLRPTRRRSFMVGVSRVRLCGGVRFRAVDTASHTASARSARPLCPSPATPPRPHFTVLKGHAMSPVVHRLVASSAPTRVDMTLGDELYLWEPGTSTPAFSAHADGRYLVLLEQDQTPPRMCPAVDCAQGFAWLWSAVKTGTTDVDLSPACRLVTPPCGRPDLAIMVHISS